MNKEDYIQKGILVLTQSSIAALLPFGALAIMLLGILDYFVTPENFTKFLIYRVIASSLIILLFVNIFRLVAILFAEKISLYFSNIIHIFSWFIMAALILYLFIKTIK